MSVRTDLRGRLRAGLERSPLWQHFQHLPPRDRMALTGLAAFIALVLGYLLVWQPAERLLGRAQEHYRQQQELHAYLQANAEQARRSAGPARRGLEPEKLQGVVTGTAQRHGLVLERFDSEGDNGVMLSLSKAPFEPLLRWIATLQERGAEVTEISLDRVEAGRVDVRLTVVAGS